MTELNDTKLSEAVEKLVSELLKAEIVGIGSGRLVGMLLNDHDVREAAISALVSIGSPAVSHVVPVLLESGIMARWTAARVLGEIRDQAAIMPLLQTLNDPNPTVRNSTIAALGKIGDPIAKILR